MRSHDERTFNSRYKLHAGPFGYTEREMNVKQHVTWREPTVQRLSLGQKPAFAFNDNATVSKDYVDVSDSTNLSGPTQTVWGDVPLKNSDGSPQLHEVAADLDLTPRSPLKYGLIAGAIGAGVGALGGLAVARGVGALVGALGVGTLAGGGAALFVRNDKAKVIWNEHQVTDHKLLGYHEYVGIGESGGKRGFFHRYVPDVQESIIGSYTTPQVVHYKEESKS